MESLLKENERIDDLQINNLKIIQNKNGFCFGIDSVLLSDFATGIKDNSKIIDLGTGTGIISILLTAKIKAKEIVGVELQDEVADMARRSVVLNNGFYDAIVTNPPYMKTDSGLINENSVKLISRHEVQCTLEDIARISYKMLRNNGELYMVHRPDRLVDIMEIFRKYNLEIKEMRLVYSNYNSQANLVLVKAVKNGRPFLKIKKPLYIYEKDGKYTNEVLKIYNKENN